MKTLSDYEKARRDEAIRLKNKIKSIDSDIESYQELINQLNRKKKALEFSLAQYKEDYIIKSNPFFKHKWGEIVQISKEEELVICKKCDVKWIRKQE